MLEVYRNSDDKRIIYLRDLANFQVLLFNEGREDVRARFVQEVLSNHNLREIWISAYCPNAVEGSSAYKRFREDFWSQICACFGSNPGLEKVKFIGFTELDDAYLVLDPTLVLDFLEAAPHIRSLVIHDYEQSFVDRNATGVVTRALGLLKSLENFECRDIPHPGTMHFMPALMAAPSLRHVTLSFTHYYIFEGRNASLALDMPYRTGIELIANILRKPNLQELAIEFLAFQQDHYESLASELGQESVSPSLTFRDCVFIEGRGGVLSFEELVPALRVNQTLESLELVLLENFTLRSLEWVNVIPFLTAMLLNRSIKRLSLLEFDWEDTSLCSAMRCLLESSTSNLEHLELDFIDDEAWCRICPATSGNLKSLKVGTVFPSLAPLIQFAMSNSLESLAVLEDEGDSEPFDYISALVELTKKDSQLKRLVLGRCSEELWSASDKKQLTETLHENYYLEEFAIYTSSRTTLNVPEASVITRLNAAGRRYLVNGDNGVSRGVHVLSRVADDPSAMFYHLRENPSLWDHQKLSLKRKRDSCSLAENAGISEE
jgi:hypothetical protein